MLDGVLYYDNPTLPGGKLCLVVPDAERETLLREVHAGKFSGHFAEKRVYDLLRRQYWWKGMRADVRKYCRSCLTCATRKGTG